jgi:hypothetical protein
MRIPLASDTSRSDEVPPINTVILRDQLLFDAKG